METLLLTLDTIAIMVICYFSFRSEKTRGQPELGPFRIRSAKETVAQAKPTGERGRPAPERQVRRR